MTKRQRSAAAGLFSEKNRRLLSWLGGGIAAVVTAVWTVYMYINGSNGSGGGTGIVNFNGTMSNSTINNQVNVPKPADPATPTNR